ncbi:MAG TPA: SCO family protein [Candidatus Binatia bacterium]|nr:SCO family protein [Candidatus Binatia bacterium]
MTGLGAFCGNGRVWRLAAALFIVAMILVSAGAAAAHDERRPAALRDVEFEQKLDQQLPLDVRLRDSDGNSGRLADYFAGKPVLLNFVYYRCRELCPLLSDGLVRVLSALSFDIGDQFDVITVSFDPTETAADAASAKAQYIKRYGRDGATRGWHFLTGERPAIDALADAAGFRYSYDARKNEFAHATGIVVVTPQGKLSRYYYGIDFSPRDLRLGLIEAAAGKIGSAIDQLLLFCYHYDPLTGQYNLIVTRVLRLAGVATVLALAGFIALMLRRDRRPRITSTTAPES